MLEREWTELEIKICTEYHHISLITSINIRRKTSQILNFTLCNQLSQTYSKPHTAFTLLAKLTYCTQHIQGVPTMPAQTSRETSSHQSKERSSYNYVSRKEWSLSQTERLHSTTNTLTM